MNIKIYNCNNIEDGDIQIIENTLNIKYAINGTGKTSLSRAIELSIKDKNNASSELIKLKPFKYRNSTDNYNPEIIGLENINSIAIFNEDYVNQYVFLKDEIVKNSFDIFIKNEKFESGMSQINNLIETIRTTFEENDDIDILINDLGELSDCFGKSKSGYSASGSIAKGIGKGNKVINIPEGLKVYEDYIKNDKNVTWLKWQMSGNEYIDISEKCPYCTSGITEKKDTILSVSKEYDSKLIEHLNKVVNVLKKLSNYFTEEVNLNIDKITKNINGISKDEIDYLVDIKKYIDKLREKLIKIKVLNFHTLKDVNKVVEAIKEYKIDLSYYVYLNTKSTEEKIGTINSSLDEILTKAGILQGEINKQKKHIEETIKEYKEEIDDFLRYAGYNYSVNIIPGENESYKLILNHNEHTENIDNAKEHLSYGERNAFALVLFMFDVIKNSPDIIILDDPISSFDKNKKFAIINRLFRGKKSLRGKTVIFLTHDFDPIIDIIYNLPHKFNFSPNAYFLQNIKGQLTEKEIKKCDIKTFLEIAKDNINSLDEDINKLIYIRRICEINNEKNEAYHLLSNLFHKIEKPLFKANNIEREMTETEIYNATEEIKKEISDFDYKDFYGQIINTKKMIHLYEKAENNYEKLQIYRIINNNNNENDVIKKFVNEVFHIENDYLFQLNPCKYEIVPQYIIEECNKDIANIKINVKG